MLLMGNKECERSLKFVNKKLFVFARKILQKCNFCNFFINC